MHNADLLLGKQVPSPRSYSPDILTPIAREPGRQSLGELNGLSFAGEDYWYCWELSWLSPAGVPQVRVGRLHIPATSPHIIESKSLKLYFNSLNGEQFADDHAARQRMVADISAVAGAQVTLHFFKVDDTALFTHHTLPGNCIDELKPGPIPASPQRHCLRVSQSDESIALHQYHSHLLRSLCPVTGQPDWASVLVTYEGRALQPASLLTYILAYRQHQGFHEQCVEQIFVDMMRVLEPGKLLVQACYTRRGGLDINPVRWHGDIRPEAIWRMVRQ